MRNPSSLENVPDRFSLMRCEECGQRVYNCQRCGAPVHAEEGSEPENLAPFEMFVCGECASELERQIEREFERDLQPRILH